MKRSDERFCEIFMPQLLRENAKVVVKGDEIALKILNVEDTNTEN